MRLPAASGLPSGPRRATVGILGLAADERVRWRSCADSIAVGHPGTQEELLSGAWLSDHRPLSVSLELHDHEE